MLAISRSGQLVAAKLGTVPLRVGDTLIVIADPGFRDRWRDRLAFLDRLDLTTLKSERLFRSDATAYETVIGLLDAGAAKVLTRRETRMQPPNYAVLELKDGARRAVTEQYPDVQPELPPRSRGVIALLEENCTVCMQGAREGPDWCIDIDSHKETIPAPPGGR